jgi:hypothetical protein
MHQGVLQAKVFELVLGIFSASRLHEQLGTLEPAIIQVAALTM